MIIDLTFKAKRKRNFYGQTTYIVKISFFDVSASINSYLAFNLEKNFGEPSLVYVRVILLVEADKMGEYLHPHIELETLRVYTCMYTMVMDASIRTWILTLPKFDEPF